jgi:hypothetical protein
MIEFEEFKKQVSDLYKILCKLEIELLLQMDVMDLYDKIKSEVRIQLHRGERYHYEYLKIKADGVNRHGFVPSEFGKHVQNVLMEFVHETSIEDFKANELIAKHQIGFFFALGIDKYLESKFKSGKPNDRQLANLIAQLINETEPTKIDTIRSEVKDYRNKKKYYSTPMQKTIEKLRIEHDLIELIKKG